MKKYSELTTPKQKIAWINQAIKKHGSAYKAALAEGISPQAFYDRMDALSVYTYAEGMERTPRNFLVLGEPADVPEKKKWLGKLLKGKTVHQVAKRIGRSPSAVRERMKKCGINRANHGAEPAGLKNKTQRKEWLKTLLRKHGKVAQVAQVLKITPQAVYERMERYGL